MNSASDMPTPPLPTASPISPEQHQHSALRRDLVRTEDVQSRHYYGQLVDIEWRPYRVQLSDAAASLMCAEDRAHA